jgi:predicted ATP-binding protein involved in virulence
MLISEIGIRGFRSFGNNEQVVKLNTEKGELILLVGNNGNGKSVVDETEIMIKMSIENLDIDDFCYFLEVMDMGSEYIEYIKINNYSLYEQYIKKQKSIGLLSDGLSS